MATPFKPFLIANAKTGLDLALDPWLLPGDAYTVLDNASLHQGRIEKRLGQAVLGACSNVVWDIDSNQPVTDIDTGTVVIDPLINPSSTIMGIFQYQDNLGNIQLIALNQKRLFKFASGNFYDLAGVDCWSGGDSDFFHQETWLNNMYLCNGVDQLYCYDGSSVNAVMIDPGATGANTITGMQFVFAYKDRLVIFNTVEDGVRVPQMARWCAIGDPTSWPNSAYLRAPTQDTIIGAAFVGDVIHVFFNKSTWAFIYLGDSSEPFYWQKIAGPAGAVAKKGVIPYGASDGDHVLSIGPSRIIGNNGISGYYADEKIPTIVSQMNPALFQYCHSVLHDKLSQVWIAYPSISATQYPDKLLIFNRDDGNWATYSYAQSVLGTWDQTYNSGTGLITAGYPQVLAGTRDGRVLQLNTGGTDLGAAITATITTGQLNPFVKQGQRCLFGWLDMLVDTQAAGLMTVQFFADGYPSAYSTVSNVPCTDGKGGTKSLIRIPVNCEAAFHQIQITHTTADQLVIHALLPYAKPGGRLNG